MISLSEIRFVFSKRVLKFVILACITIFPLLLLFKFVFNQDDFTFTFFCILVSIMIGTTGVRDGEYV